MAYRLLRVAVVAIDSKSIQQKVAELSKAAEAPKTAKPEEKAKGAQSKNETAKPEKKGKKK